MNVAELILAAGHASAPAILQKEQVVTYAELRAAVRQVADVCRLWTVACPPTTDHRPPATDHRPPATDHRPPTTDHRPPTTDHRPPTTDHRPPSTGPRIGIFSENSPFFVSAYLGIMNAGMVAVPFQTEVAQDTFNKIVASAGIRLLFVSPRFERKLRPWAEALGLQLIGESFLEGRAVCPRPPSPSTPLGINGQSTVVSSPLLVSSPSTVHGPPSTDHRPPTTDHRPPTTDQYSTTPVLQHSITPVLQHSTTPVLHHSTTPVLHHSTTPPLQSTDLRPPSTELAALLFTSGSTGEPKGVMVTHRNIECNTRDIISYMGLTPQDRVMVVLPFHYCYGLSLLHSHLMAGASLVLNNDFRLYPETVLRELQERECTGFAGVPSTYQILLRKSRFRQMTFPKLRWFQQAGGKLPNPCIQEIRESFPNVPYYLMYGQTEATARLSYLPPERLADKLGSIGKGLPSTKLEVLKADGTPVKPHEKEPLINANEREYGTEEGRTEGNEGNEERGAEPQPLINANERESGSGSPSTVHRPQSTAPTLHHSTTPVLHHSTTPVLHHSTTPSLQFSTTPSLHHSASDGEVGEIVASGDNITAGYWNDPAETAKFFRNGKLYTGDLARVDSDGFIFIVERERDMIKSGGNRVSAKEIEDVIAELQEVVEVAVVGAPHDLLGESIKAFVVLHPNSTLLPANIEQHCRKRLPTFKTPEKVIILKAMPHNSSGKVMKAQLKAQAAATANLEAGCIQL